MLYKSKWGAMLLLLLMMMMMIPWANLSIWSAATMADAAAVCATNY
jgi:hypothetical protein